MATIKDVAKEAGVAVATVSRVLNNRGYISEDMKKKVSAAMEKLQYQPNEVARSLYRKKSNIIGLIVPTVSHPFFGELTNYIEYYAYKNGYKILLCNSQLDRTKEKEYVDMLKRNQVDGIIMGSHTLDIEDYLDLNLPIVTIDRKISDKIPYVSSDNYKGGELATNLLIESGCENLALFTGNLHLHMLSNNRHHAYEDVANMHGVKHVTVETDLNVFDSDKYENLIYNFLRKYSDIDGIFANSDILAAQTIKICSKLGKKIPDDIKIVGYDDVRISSLAIPEITTIRQPVDKMSEKAIELIIKQCDNEYVTMENILPVTLVKRSTC
ncbi:MAG: LacI family DNA-binding transcriptional regulator [Clostridiaceae bacterium]